jgi:CIC family chloride channel protein
MSEVPQRTNQVRCRLPTRHSATRSGSETDINAHFFLKGKGAAPLSFAWIRHAIFAGMEGRATRLLQINVPASGNPKPAELFFAKVFRTKMSVHSSGGIRQKISSLLLRITPNDKQRLLALTLISGALCGLSAVAFHVGIGKMEVLLIDRALGAPGPHWIYLGIITPALGGLLTGLALHYWVPGAVGSGIPQVKVSYATRSGRVTGRDAIGKFFLGIFQIGSGASLGREGPTVQICAGVSNFLARTARLSLISQRRMCAVGVAAGIAAAFNAPIAAVTFTLEEIVGDLDQTMLSGVIVAAAIAAVVERSILGQHPVFDVPRLHTLDSPSSLILYAILGILAAIIGVIFTDSLLGLRAQFKRLKSLPRWAHPAIGGAVTGLLAVCTLFWLKEGGVTGGGYRTLALALAGSLPVKAMIVLCLVKLAATVSSYSSGGSGGIFAPALFIGSMLGGAVGHANVVFLHHSPDSVGAFALVGMGAVFAAIIRAPMTSVLIIFEMTGGYGLILPLMIANMTAYALARHWRHTPVYEALLLQDGVVLPHGQPVIVPSSKQEHPGEVPP